MNIFLDRKLKNWHKAGIIDEATAVKISEFENEYKSSYIINSIIGLGGIAIIVGIISVIAANWYLISGQVKLLFNLIWLLSLAISILYAQKINLSIIKELLIFILFGSILGSIALVGQVYHLEGHIFNTLFAWLILGTPIILFSKTKYLPYVWVFALTALYFSFLSYTQDIYKMNQYLSLVTLLPIIFFYLIELFGLFKNRSNFKDALLYIGAILFCGIVSVVGTVRWSIPEHTPVWPTVVVCLATIPLLLIYLRRKLELIATIIIAGIIFSEVPNMFTHTNLKVFGSILFIAMWSLIAFAGIKLRYKKVFDWSCLIIALRIITIYFEVFGTLLQTGIGLILSGLVIVSLALLWHKKRDLIWNLGRSDK